MHHMHAWTAPAYGTKVQYAAENDTTPPLSAKQLTRLQQIIGIFLYYARAIDSTMLVALGIFASAQTKGTGATTIAVTHLLDYCASHPDAILCFSASQMALHDHSNASYLSEKKARSRAGGIFFLSNKLTPPDKAPLPDAILPPNNGAIHVHSSIMSAVLSPTTEAEIGALLFFNGKEVMLRNTLRDMGHAQLATSIQTDNSCEADRQRHRQTTSIQNNGHAILLDPRQGSPGTFTDPLTKRHRQSCRLFYETSLALTPPSHAPALSSGTTHFTSHTTVILSQMCCESVLIAPSVRPSRSIQCPTSHAHIKTYIHE
jgi:hypothetical protein